MSLSPSLLPLSLYVPLSSLNLCFTSTMLHTRHNIPSNTVQRQPFLNAHHFRQTLLTIASRQPTNQLTKRPINVSRQPSLLLLPFYFPFYFRGKKRPAAKPGGGGGGEGTRPQQKHQAQAGNTYQGSRTRRRSRRQPFPRLEGKVKSIHQ